MKTGDIHKVAGILIKDRKILVEKDIDKDFFIAPGGKPESGESDTQTLVRELQEELLISVDPVNLEKIGTYTAPAAGQEHRTVYMQVYLVKKWTGTITPGHKVEELLWINSLTPAEIKVGSIFQHEVVPILKNRNLID